MGQWLKLKALAVYLSILIGILSAFDVLAFVATWLTCDWPTAIHGAKLTWFVPFMLLPMAFLMGIRGLMAIEDWWCDGCGERYRWGAKFCQSCGKQRIKFVPFKR